MSIHECWHWLVVTNIRCISLIVYLTCLLLPVRYDSSSVESTSLAPLNSYFGHSREALGLQ